MPQVLWVFTVAINSRPRLIAFCARRRRIQQVIQGDCYQAQASRLCSPDDPMRANRGLLRQHLITDNWQSNQ